MRALCIIPSISPVFDKICLCKSWQLEANRHWGFLVRKRDVLYLESKTNSVLIVPTGENGTEETSVSIKWKLGVDMVFHLFKF